MASSLAFLQPLANVSSSSTLLFLRNPHHIPSSSSSLKPSNFPKTLPFKSLTASFSLAESDSPKSFQPNGPNFQSFLQELADSLDLPPDYFAQLPNDLRLDLNDAAFDLSNGRVIDECGQELGETLLNLSRAWEQADTSTSHALANKLPGLEDSMTGNAKSAFGKRLVSAGRRFQSMGQYGQGELQKIAKVMITTGRVCALMAVGWRRRVGRLQERRRGGCTRCSRWNAKYFDWQTVRLMHSYRKARQPGPITRLLSCTDDEKKKYKGRHLAPTFEVPSISSHPKTGDWYPAINKPAGVVHWLKHSKEAENVDWVVILDADMIIHGPIIPWELGAEKGKPVAAYYGQEHWKCHVNSL